MKSVILISMVLAFLCAAANAKISGGLFTDPRYPGKCTFDESLILGAGDIMKNPKGKCSMITCYENGQAIIFGCAKQGMREGCTEGEVLYPEAKYPECCNRKITCDRFYYSPNY